MVIQFQTLNRILVLLVRFYRLSLLAIFLIFSFRILTKFPFGDTYLHLESIVEVFLVLFTLYYMFTSSNKNNLVLIPKAFAIGVAAFTFYCALMAKIQFGQPYLIGVLTNRQFLLGLSGIFIYYLIKNNIVGLLDVKKCFIFLVWFCFFTYLILIFLIPDAAIEGSRLIDHNTSKGGVVYRYDPTFIVFGIIYYSLKGISQNSLKSYILALVLILYIMYFQRGRGLFLSAIIPVAFYILFKTSISKKIILGGIGMILVIGIVLLTSFSERSFLTEFLSSFENVISVLTGKESGEGSADSRIVQVTKTLNYWSDDISKFIFGSGYLSNRWKNGYQGFIGYYYPVDIGFFGVTFVTGIIGLLYFKIQYLITYRIWKRIKRVTEQQDIFIVALLFFIMQIFFKSFLNGEDTFHSQKGLIAIFILYAYYQKAKEISLLEN